MGPSTGEDRAQAVQLHIARHPRRRAAEELVTQQARKLRTCEGTDQEREDLLAESCSIDM